VVLGSGTDHGRTADIDGLDAGGEGCPLGHGGLERIKVDDQEIDGGDAMRLGRRLVLGIAANRQQPAMHPGVQRLEPTIHHLRKAGLLGNVARRDSRGIEGTAGATGRQDVDPKALPVRAQTPRAGFCPKPRSAPDGSPQPLLSWQLVSPCLAERWRGL
jgi:hypothetical protein